MDKDFKTLDEISDGQFTGTIVVCVHGYELKADLKRFEDNSDVPGIWIVPKSDMARAVPVMSSLQCTGLHRKLAKLAKDTNGPSVDAVLRFAGRFGLLGDANPRHQISQSLVPVSWSEAPAWPPIMGERFFDWVQRIDEVAALLAFWDLINNEDRNELQKFIQWQGSPERLSVYFAFDGKRLTTDQDFAHRFRTYTWDGEWDSIADASERRGQYEFEVHPRLRGPKPDYVAAARRYLYRRINRRLAGNITAGLDMQREPGHALVFEPISLTGAIYLHFAREVMGAGAAWQQCANPKCNLNFRPRSNKKYCSDACRLDNWRSVPARMTA